MSEEKEHHHGGELIEINLSPGQRLYACNFKGGSLVECNDKLKRMGKKWFILSQPDTFYYGALNMVNAEFKLKSIAEKYGAKINEATGE